MDATAKTQNSPLRLRIGFLLILILTVVYVYIYQWQPFVAPWNDNVLNLLIFSAAAAGAVVVTLVMRQFGADEPPLQVWRNFALALWSWAAAEGVWAVLAIFYGDVPVIYYPDIFWVLGIIFFFASFLSQYRLIYRFSIQKQRLWIVLIQVVLWVLAMAGAWLLVSFGISKELTWLEASLQLFYVFTDLALALAALRLAQVFGRGLWGRAWLGLLVFTVSDGSYTWLVMSGLYAISAESGNYLSLFVDTLYFDAYLLMAVACYAHLLLLRYGPQTLSRSVSFINGSQTSGSQTSGSQASGSQT